MAGYDALVIGAGTAGEGVLWTLHDAGMHVAVVEKELVGGLCAYWGCMPSKTLLRPGTVRWEAQHSVGTSPPQLTWSEIVPYRNWMVRDFNDSKQVTQLRDAGIDFIRGDATITAPGHITVDGHTLSAKRLVIATGSEATIPPIPGLKETGYWTNREGTALTEIPSSALILGGGAVGCELGQILHTYGATVTIVEEADHLLGRENPDAARYLQAEFQRQRIGMRLGRKAVRIERIDQDRIVTLDDGTTVTAEVILVATGRHALIEGLGLEHLDVTLTKQGIAVNEFCRAGATVWAVGDVTGVAMYTHVASYQATIAAADILGKPRPANYSDIPNVTFTDPEVASVGITDPRTAPEGMELVTAQADLEETARTDTYGKGYTGALSLLADRHDKVLVGAWAVGPLAGEWVQWAALAIRARVPVSVLDDTILAFPTFTRLYLAPLTQLQRQL